MPQLIVQREGFPEEVHELTAERITVGYRRDNDLRIGEESVSGHHAELNRTGAGYRYRDLGSTNGSYVGGIPIVEHDLHSGDVVMVGAVPCLYRAEAAVPRPVAAAVRYPKPPFPLPKSPIRR